MALDLVSFSICFDTCQLAHLGPAFRVEDDICKSNQVLQTVPAGLLHLHTDLNRGKALAKVLDAS